MAERQGYVYILATIGTPVAYKIGWSKNPPNRRNLAQTDNHMLLELVCYFPGSEEDERGYHWKFRAYKTVGYMEHEWFWKNGGLDALIDAKKKKFPVPMQFQQTPLVSYPAPDQSKIGPI
jgi:hypothetical protein